MNPLCYHWNKSVWAVFWFGGIFLWVFCKVKFINDLEMLTFNQPLWLAKYIVSVVFSSLFSIEPLRSSAVDSLFVLDLHGNLTEYVLEPQGVKTVPQSDDTPLELLTTARAQWTLTRYNWVKLPIALYKFFLLFLLNFASLSMRGFLKRTTNNGWPIRSDVFVFQPIGGKAKTTCGLRVFPRFATVAHFSFKFLLVQLAISVLFSDWPWVKTWFWF